jgi:hypothetical protein
MASASCAGSGMLRLSRWRELRQPGRIAGRHGHRELRAEPVEAAVNGPGHAAHGPGPDERFLDLVSAPAGQGVAGTPGRAPVDGRVSGLLRDIRRHHHPPETGDEGGRVLSPVGPGRQAPGRARGAAVLHQPVAGDARHRRGAPRLLARPRLGVRSRTRGARSNASRPGSSLRRCATGGLCRASAGSRSAGAADRWLRGLPGWWLRRAARIAVMIGWRVVLGLETLHGRRRLARRAVDGDVPVRQQRSDLRVRQGSRPWPFTTCRSPAAGRGCCRTPWTSGPGLRPFRAERPSPQTGPSTPSPTNHRDPCLQVHRAEQRSARLVRPAHRHPRRCRDGGGSCSRNRAETEFPAA